MVLKEGDEGESRPLELPDETRTPSNDGSWQHVAALRGGFILILNK